MKILDRLLMRYLQRRGWVVFWLDVKNRHCSAIENRSGVCWLECWEGERKRKTQ